MSIFVLMLRTCLCGVVSGLALSGLAQTDTLRPPALSLLACAAPDSLRVYDLSPTPSDPDQWGYVAGPNSYGDRKVALRYATQGLAGHSLDAIWAQVAALQSGQGGTVRAQVFSHDGGPDSLLSSSDELPLAQVNPDGLTWFSLTPPLLLQGDSLWLALDFSTLYLTQDTLGLTTTRFGCAVDSSAHLQLFNGQWVAFAAAGSEGGWDAPLEPMLGGVVSLPAPTPRLGHPAASLSATLHTPPQATDLRELRFELAQPSLIGWRIVNQQGQTCQTRPPRPYPAGKQTETIAVTTLPPGLYLLLLMHEDSTTMLKFVR